MTNKTHTPIQSAYIVAIGVAFLILMLLVRYDISLVRMVDLSIAAFLKPLQTYHLIQFFLIVTVFGGITGVLSISAGLLFFIRRQKNNMLELVVLLSGITVSAQLIKVFIERARPETLTWLSTLHSYSFPSGHATSAVALYGFIALIAHRELRSSTTRTLTVSLSLIAIVLIAVSRLVLNVHYFSDVIGGLLLGTFWLLFIRKLGSR